jgi:hypothetical protein
VAQLNADLDGRMTTHRRQNRRQRIGMRVGPQAQVIWRDAAFRHDGRGFKGDQRGAGQRQAAKMDHVPVGGQAIDSGILAHRRDGNTVGQLEGAERVR